MWPISLLRSLKSDSPGTPRQRGRRLGRHQRQRFVPRLEALEDRTVLSTFTVLNLGDSGAGSLRQAILDANALPGADDIAFAPGLAGTIALASGQLDITDDLEINGPGVNRLTISGNDADRVLHISSGTTVSLNRLTVAHGRAVEGAGVLNLGTLTVSRSVFADNQALGGPGEVARGGGIFNSAGATLTVLDGTFTGNQAVGGADATGRGGGIFNQGLSLSVVRTTFSHNLAQGGPRSTPVPPSGVNASLGGGIANEGGPTFTVSHSTFTGNRAIGGAGEPGVNGVNGAGGAINNIGFPIGLATLTVSHSTFSQNQAIGGTGGAGANGAGGNGNGGALSNQPGAQTTVTHSIFSDNDAMGGDGGAGGVGGRAN